VGSKSSKGEEDTKIHGLWGGKSLKGESPDGIDMTNSPEGDFLSKRKVMWRENLEKALDREFPHGQTVATGLRPTTKRQCSPPTKPKIQHSAGGMR
jgi:hypothetical protein